MNKYSVAILPKAIDELSKIDKPIAKRITDKLTWFSENVEVVELRHCIANFRGFTS